ncbi:MATE family efflux transporter, partial [Methanobrevibacter sp.]
MVSPFFLISAVIYTLYGQGGSLLSIKAKSDLNNEKSNIYFTFSIIGAIIICLIYMILIFIFADSLLHLLNIPQDIFNTSKIYLLIISGFFTLNAYIRVLGYFLKADGQAGTTFNAILIANITNLCLDVLLFNLFEQKIVGIALALVLGYLVGAIYISKYFFNKNATFKLIPLRKIRLRNLFIFKIKALKKTPELVGRILIVLKTTVIVYLCGTYLGDAGLLAFLIYDNLETILYMFVSGIIKTISPFLTVFYNEKDYPSVEYMERLSTKHVLIFIISIGAIIFAFPEKILEMFNITAVHDQMIIAPAIRITSIGLIGRCICMIISNYTQSIFQSRISALISFLEEGILPFALIAILIPIFKGTGIWITLTLADTIPILIYFAIILSKRNKYSTLKNCIF